MLHTALVMSSTTLRVQRALHHSPLFLRKHRGLEEVVASAVRVQLLVKEDGLGDIKYWIAEHLQLHERFIVLRASRVMQALWRGAMARKWFKSMRKIMHDKDYTLSTIRVVRKLQKRWRSQLQWCRRKKRYRCARRWRKVFISLSAWYSRRKAELLHRMVLQTKSLVLILPPKKPGDIQDVTLTLLGYSVGTRGLISVPENVRMIGRYVFLFVSIFFFCMCVCVCILYIYLSFLSIYLSTHYIYL